MLFPSLQQINQEVAESGSNLLQPIQNAEKHGQLGDIQEEEIPLMGVDFAVLALLWTLSNQFGIVVELFPDLFGKLIK